MSRSDPDTRFHSVFHLVINEEHLRDCFQRLPADKAVGIDGATKRAYGERLEENLRDLVDRLHRGSYRPRPAKRVWIEKPGSDKKRPLAVSCFEDKLVQLALADLLGAVYEPVFLPCSYGYRPKRGVHHCLDELGRRVQKRKVNHVLEADLRSYFDRMNHDWLVKFVQHRISDRRVSRLLVKLLRSGILEDGLTSANDEGAPQGSVVSPILSNIHLHHVLDLWHAHRASRRMRGECHLFRFADDFVVCFQHKADALRYRAKLEERLRAFNLELAEEKTGLVGFGRFEEENARRAGRKPGSFVFLGFRHVCGKSRRGYFKVKRQTCGKRPGRSLKELKGWLDKHRAFLRKGELIRAVGRKVQGHLVHFGITDNIRACGTYLFRANRLLFRALRRKSQRRPYTWKGFHAALRHNRWPEPAVHHNLDPMREVWKQDMLKGYSS